MSASNSWAEFAGLYRRPGRRSSRASGAKTELKNLMPEDAKEATGHGVRAKRSKSGAVSFDLLELGGRPCTAPVKRSAPSPRRWPRPRRILTNPEKSLRRPSAPGFPATPNATFRYASLASDLEIVRKSLSQHEIATVQTTTIDRELIDPPHDAACACVRRVDVLGLAGLPHRRDQRATPHGRSADLRPALHAVPLVGIAGEDDLDAPDLAAGRPTGAPPAAAGSPGSADGHAAPSGAAPGNGALGRPGPQQAPRAILAPEASAERRDELLSGLSGHGFGRGDGPLGEAGNSGQEYPAGRKIAPVEQAFERKLERLAADERAEVAPALPADPRTGRACGRPAGPGHREASSAGKRSGAGGRGICGGRLRPRLRRPRLRQNTAQARQGPPRVGRRKAMRGLRAPSADAHHLRFAQPRAIGLKVSDEFTVPLCRIHHRELHLRVDEVAWWQEHKIDPLEVARRLWADSRGTGPGDASIAPSAK